MCQSTSASLRFLKMEKRTDVVNVWGKVSEEEERVQYLFHSMLTPVHISKMPLECSGSTAKDINLPSTGIPVVTHFPQQYN